MYKSISVVVADALLGILLASKHLSQKLAVPDNYQTETETGGYIEAKYMKNGPYGVSIKEIKVLMEIGKFKIYYPTGLTQTNRKYPVIVICNGSGTPLSKFPAVAKHYASWGFIVIGTEEDNAWNAYGAERGIRYLERVNDNEEIGDTKSIFYQKVDFSNVGIVGHSQGGIGVINAITDTRHKDVYKCAVALSPANKELASDLSWDYDASLVKIPILLIAGHGGGDDWVVTGKQFNDIVSDILSAKIAMRRKHTIHKEVLYKPDGYVTAWFMYHLQGDEEAGKAFYGDSPEVLKNDLYQDFVLDLK